MPKYLLLKYYRGGPAPHHSFPPMDQWAPQDVEAHLAFLRQISELLKENGEFVDAQALTPSRTWVRYGGPDAAPVTTDGPLPETSDLAAGWFMIDVESHERALELAAYVSSEPGPALLTAPSTAPAVTSWDEAHQRRYSMSSNTRTPATTTTYRSNPTTLTA